MTLPADIAALIDAYAHAERTNLWNEGSPFPTPGFVNMVPETRAALESAIAELAADRDRYRDALVARHGGEPLALLSELDAARAERDAAREACERKHQDGWAWAQLAQQREAELDAARAEAEKLRIESQANADTLVDWRRKAEFLLQEREQGVAARETLDDVCKALGADVDSAVPQALMFKEKAAEAEKLRAELAAVTAYRDGMIAAFSKLYGPEVQVDEHASTLARLIGDSHTLADIALELMDTEHGAEGSLAEAVRVLMSSLAAVTAQRDELLHRARQTVWQGITCGKPYQLIPGEPLRAQLILLGELCGAIEEARAQPEQPQQPKEADHG